MVTLKPGGGQRHVEFREEGVKSLASFVGLPWNIVAKLHPDTFGDAATQLLRRKERYSLMVKEGTVTEVATPSDLKGLNPTRVLAAIEGGIRGLEYHRVLILKNQSVCLELIGERREPVIAGDLIQAGAQVTFSPLGTIQPKVSSYALRLMCTNGMRSNTVLREFTYGGGGGDGDDIWQWFRESAKEAYNSLARIVERYREMSNELIPPEQRAAILEAMLKEAKISGADASAVRALAIESPPQNSYDMLNLLTHATSHLLQSSTAIVNAQEAAATYASASTHARMCPMCHATRN